MSRDIGGSWSVLMIWHEEDGTPVFQHWGPESYDECAKFALLLGMGVPFEGRRVERAILVGPVSE